jgi:hypothetical protein
MGKGTRIAIARILIRAATLLARAAVWVAPELS